MKWFVLCAVTAVMAMPSVSSASRSGLARRHAMARGSATLVFPYIGRIPQMDDRSPTLWGMAGMDMINVTKSANGMTPIMRTETWDARAVEILSGTENPPLRADDIRVVSQGGRDYVAVRRFLLLEVTPEDARANGMSTNALAHQWAASVKKVLPQVAPFPSRFGV